MNILNLVVIYSIRYYIMSNDNMVVKTDLKDGEIQDEKILENNGTFYTDNPLSVWQSVLGPSMHYHVGGNQAVRNLYPYIDNNSKILDIGCGWGGPARLLTNEKG